MTTAKILCRGLFLFPASSKTGNTSVVWKGHFPFKQIQPCRNNSLLQDCISF